METILAENAALIGVINGREVYLINDTFLLSAPVGNQFLNRVQTEMREINEQERNIIRLMPQSPIPETTVVPGETELMATGLSRNEATQRRERILQLNARYNSDELPIGNFVVQS